MSEDAWDFDETTPVESNRRKPTYNDTCKECGHVHLNKGPNFIRCWVPVFKPGSLEFTRCKCWGQEDLDGHVDGSDAGVRVAPRGRGA